MNLAEWEKVFEDKVVQLSLSGDPAHDLLHFKRVVRTSKLLNEKEGGDLWVILPAAWLHDFVNVPKDSPMRSQASCLSATKAIEFLRSIQYPAENYNGIKHAIEAHSFSAGIEAETLEAKIVQDADRLDGLGAVGIARCFATAGLLKRSFYSPEDPFCDYRPADDSQYTIDHFFKKLFKTGETLKTKAGIEEGYRRVERMKDFLHYLREEIGTSRPSHSKGT